MSEQEKLQLAEEFVRKAMVSLGVKASEKTIKSAAKKAAEGLPPFYDARAGGCDGKGTKRSCRSLPRCGASGGR